MYRPLCWQVRAPPSLSLSRSLSRARSLTHSLTHSLGLYVFGPGTSATMARGRKKGKKTKTCHQWHEVAASVKTTPQSGSNCRRYSCQREGKCSWNTASSSSTSQKKISKRSCPSTFVKPLCTAFSEKKFTECCSVAIRYHINKGIIVTNGLFFLINERVIVTNGLVRRSSVP